MNINFDKVFKKDATKLSPNIKNAVSQLVIEVQKAQSLESIVGIKKLKGYKSYFRVRIGDYRVGLYIENDVVIFSRALHRKDIYKYFP